MMSLRNLYMFCSTDLLQEAMAWRIVRAVFQLVGSITKMVFGIIDIDSDNLKEGVDGVVDDAQGMVDSMQILSFSVQQVEALDRLTDEIFHQLE